MNTCKSKLELTYELCKNKELLITTQEMGTVYVILDGKIGVHKYPYSVYFNHNDNLSKKQFVNKAIRCMHGNMKTISLISCQVNPDGVLSLMKFLSQLTVIPGFSLSFDTVKSINLPTN